MRPAGIHPVGTVQSGIPAGRAEDPRRYSQRVSGNKGVTDSVKTENKSPSYSSVLSLPNRGQLKGRFLTLLGDLRAQRANLKSRRDDMRVAPDKRSAVRGNEEINIPLFPQSAAPACRRARRTAERGSCWWGPVTQGGSRCAPLPWATFSLPLRGARWSLLTSADKMRFIITISHTSVEQTGMSRSSQWQSQHQWRLIPVAELTSFADESVHESPA